MSVPAARHVCNTFYTDTLNPIVQHHIDSYNDLLERQIPIFLKASNPIRLLMPSEKRSIEVYIGGRDGTQLGYTPPLDELGKTRTTQWTYEQILTLSMGLKEGNPKW